MAPFFSLLAIASIWASWLKRSDDIEVVICDNVFAGVGAETE